MELHKKEQIIAKPNALNEEPYIGYRNDFLNRFGLVGVRLEALPAHASYRRYYRVLGWDKPALLMDATLDVTEPLMWFVNVDKHLHSLGLSVPEIYHYEVTDNYSLALIEDWGSDGYDTLIEQGADALPLYEKAIGVLAHIHNHEKATDVDIVEYSIDKMLAEAENLVNWYAPAISGHALSREAIDEYLTIWRDILSNMPPIKQSIVMFDYIFNNMMRVEGRYELQSCGILDFQAARIGPAIYDVVSLLEDIRRDLSNDDFIYLRKYYLDQAKITETEEDFDLWFSVMTMQRHCKNLGGLVRLFVRDGKPELLKYIPRMQRFACYHLEKPVFTELKNWFEKHNIDLEKELEKGFEYAKCYPER